MDVQVTTRGQVQDHARRTAQEKLAALERYVDGSLRGARVMLIEEENPRIQQPAHAEAEVLLEGRPVRARAAAETMDAAIDEVAERLQRNLRRYVERMVDGKRVPAQSPAGEWRHANWSPPLAPTFRRPPGEREIVRRKSFAVEWMSLAEAAAALEALDHSFFLFRDSDTGLDGVLFRHDDGLLALIGPPPVEPPAAAGPVLEPSRFSEPIDLETALAEMDALDHRFLFFVNADTGRGNVLYLRYDGHYGLLEPPGDDS